MIDWNSYTLEQKQLIDQRLSLFLAQVMGDKFQITNQVLLESQMKLQQIRYHAYKPPLLWLYELLRAGAGQIADTAQFGFMVQPGYQQFTLQQLREMIDLEFYQLSEAHYARYVAPAFLAE